MKHHHNKKIGILFFGRFEQEKGIDILSDLIEMSSTHPLLTNHFERYCFGGGSLYSSFLSRHANNSGVHCFGWKNKDEIFRYRENIDYTIMPSRFLETFGKSALESLARDIPVVGFRKGGLKEFILPEYDLPEDPDQWVRFFSFLIQEKYNDTYKHKQQTIKQIVQRYRPHQWLKTFKQYTQGKTYIAMVSDFVEPIGGIETYCHEVASLLSSHNFRIGMFGLLGSGFWFALRKKWGMLFALYNYSAMRLFKKFLRKEERDIIWFHSVLRYIGRFPLSFLKKRHKRLIWWTMHDFGYLHPFASKVQKESDLPKEWTLNAFLQTVPDLSWYQRPLVIIKFWLLNKIRHYLLRVCDRFFVPSGYVKEHLIRLWSIDPDIVTVLPHFFDDTHYT